MIASFWSCSRDGGAAVDKFSRCIGHRIGGAVNGDGTSLISASAKISSPSENFSEGLFISFFGKSFRFSFYLRRPNHARAADQIEPERLYSKFHETHYVTMTMTMTYFLFETHPKCVPFFFYIDDGSVDCNGRFTKALASLFQTKQYMNSSMTTTASEHELVSTWFRFCSLRIQIQFHSFFRASLQNAILTFALIRDIFAHKYTCTKLLNRLLYF